MSLKDQFIQEINNGYVFKGDSIVLGGAMHDREAIPGCQVKIPLRMMNRHGLIAGATGSGKTKTLQIIAEQLSAKSVPVLLMDIKGDLSGIAAPGASNAKIEERHQKIGVPFAPSGSPVEFLTLSEEPGARLRATVTEFGPILLSKILDLTDVQSGVLSVVFKYCDDNGWALIDLKDLKKIMQYITTEGKADFNKEYGSVSTVSVGGIMRKVVELEQQGAEVFFGERSFDVNDLCRLDENGRGVVSIVRLTDIQDKPKLFSTFMLQILAEIYANFPEEGDLDAPKLVMFIDEAHLVFENATPTLLNQVETIVRLIRSKGIGVFFVTQNPADVPDAVLGQLGLKVQHSLRAFTAKDRKAIKLAAQNYPTTKYYDVETLLTELGIGEALVTTLNEKGIPTPLAHTLLRAPQSRMDILAPQEIESILKKSALVKKYNEVIDRESAYEILNEKIERALDNAPKPSQEKPASGGQRTARQEKSTIEKVLNSPTTRQIGNTVVRELTRGLLGVLGIKSTSTTRRRSNKSSWF